MTKDLKKLVSLLIAPFPKPERIQGYFDNDETLSVYWYSSAGAHCITIEACTHRITLFASYDDDGPCPPTLECGYSHVRLTMLLDWMRREGTVEELYGLLSNGAFHQKYPATDPAITKDMYGGRITDDIWREVNRATI